jgi:tetratricopeptide (TPR) repeat protein
MKSGNSKLALAAMTLSLVLFAGAIGAGFHWDDELLFSSWLPYLDGPRSILSPPPDIPHFTFQYFRPLVLVSYVADEKLAGALFPAEAREQGRRVFFHLTPVLLHVACTGLVFLLALRLVRRPGSDGGRDRWTAFAAALLFAVHPIHVESVAWIVGRSDSLCALLGLCALLAFLDWRERDRLPSLLAAGATLLLALLAKETALGVLVPALVVATSWPASAAMPSRTSRAARVIEAAVLAGVLALYALLRAAYGTDGVGLSAFSISGEALVRMPGALGWYVSKLVWPYPRAVFPPEQLGGAFVALGGMASLLLVAGFVAARGSAWRAERSALALAVGGLVLPVAVALTPFATSPVAERYLYLPSAGACLLMALLLARAARHRLLVGLSHLPAVVILAAVVALPWGWTTSRRLVLWDDPARFWSAAAETAPDSPVVFINLGQSLKAAGRLPEARAAYRRAAELATAPDQSAMAHANLGSLQLLEGRTDDAIDEFALALAHDPGEETALFNWASALVMKGRTETDPSVRRALLAEATRRLETALALHPRYAKAHLLLGTILLSNGAMELARARLQAAATIDPASVEARRARELLSTMPAGIE